MYYVYILENDARKFYIGQTEDLERRLSEHNDPSRSKSKFTAKQNVTWRIVWTEPHPDRASAMRRERQIKSMKSAKWIRETLLGSTPADSSR